MNLFPMFITKRLNFSSAGKLSDHNSGTEAGGQYFRSGLGCLKKRHVLLPFLTRNQCSAAIFCIQEKSPLMTTAHTHSSACHLEDCFQMIKRHIKEPSGLSIFVGVSSGDTKVYKIQLSKLQKFPYSPRFKFQILSSYDFLNRNCGPHSIGSVDPDPDPDPGRPEPSPEKKVKNGVMFCFVGDSKTIHISKSRPFWNK